MDQTLSDIKASVGQLVERSADQAVLRSRMDRLEGDSAKQGISVDKLDARVRTLEEQAPMNKAVTNGIRWIVGVCLLALVTALLGLVIAKPSFGPAPPVAAATK